MSRDVEIGVVTLVAASAWRDAGWIERACAVMFGIHQTSDHLGYIFRISWWRARPYLVSVREAR